MTRLAECADCENIFNRQVNQGQCPECGSTDWERYERQGASR